MPAKRAPHVPSTPSEAHDVVVVGAGVPGLGVAWRARARGLRVLVLERDVPGAGASSVAAGMLAPVSEADAGERELLALGLESARRWGAFAAELRDVTGIDVGYRATGTLVLARDRDEAEALERELDLRARLGLAAERLRPSQARALEPALAPTTRLGLSVPDDHAADPRALVAALRAACEVVGVELRGGAEVAEVLHDGRRATGVALAGGERVDAGAVLVAAGAWSGGIPGIPAPARVPVRPVKGQTVRLRDPAFDPARPLCERILRWDGGYLVPRGDGRYVLGATVEERGFDTAMTALGVHELLRDGSELLPGLLELEVDELVAGLRPGTPDNAPVLGESGALAGLHYATGHHRNGILLAPVTAELVAAELAGEGRSHGFGPERFAAAAAGAAA
jgi:glycine oxidase